MLRNLLAIFKRKPKVRYVEREIARVTVDQWRSNKDLVKQAREAMAMPIVRQMVDACRNSHLGHFTGHPGLEEKAYAWCRSEGYSIALNNLEALASFVEEKQDLIPTFEPPGLAEIDLKEK